MNRFPGLSQAITSIVILAALVACNPSPTVETGNVGMEPTAKERATLDNENLRGGTSGQTSGQTTPSRATVTEAPTEMLEPTAGATETSPPATPTVPPATATPEPSATPPPSSTATATTAPANTAVPQPTTTDPPPTATEPPSTETPVPQPAATDTAVPEPSATEAPPPAPGQVVISFVFYDGDVPQVESDEYAVITNQGGSPVNLAGWRLNAGNPGQDFTFPSFELAPGASCRVYTNEDHLEYCGFNFRSGQAIWKNSGECGYLFDASGVQVSEYCY